MSTGDTSLGLRNTDSKENFPLIYLGAGIFYFSYFEPKFTLQMTLTGRLSNTCRPQEVW